MTGDHPTATWARSDGSQKGGCRVVRADRLSRVTIQVRPLRDGEPHAAHVVFTTAARRRHLAAGGDRAADGLLLPGPLGRRLRWRADGRPCRRAAVHHRRPGRCARGDDRRDAGRRAAQPPSARRADRHDGPPAAGRTGPGRRAGIAARVRGADLRALRLRNGGLVRQLEDRHEAGGVHRLGGRSGHDLARRPRRLGAGGGRRLRPCRTAPRMDRPSGLADPTLVR